MGENNADNIGNYNFKINVIKFFVHCLCKFCFIFLIIVTLPFHFNSISFKLQIKYAQTFCFVSPGRGVRPSYSLGFFSSLSINLLSPHLFLSCFLTLNFILSLFLSLSLYLSLSLSLYLSLCPPVQYFSLYFTPNHFSSFILSILFPFISNLFSKFISFFLLSHSLPCPAYAWGDQQIVAISYF